MAGDFLKVVLEFGFFNFIDTKHTGVNSSKCFTSTVIGMVDGRFGHGRFGLGRFGQAIFKGGRFGQIYIFMYTYVSVEKCRHSMKSSASTANEVKQGKTRL